MTAEGERQAYGRDPMDQGMLRSLERDVGADELKKILPTFCSSLDGYRAQLIAELQKGSLNESRRIAHGLKGLCMQFGASHSAELARLLEADVSSVDEARELLSRLCEEIDRVERFVASWGGE